MIAIKKEMIVNTSQENAFRVFTQKIDLWWPCSHHIGKTPLVKMVLEPKVKGRWYSLHQDNEECEVGYVENFEPHSHLLLIWQLNGEFKHDLSLRSEIEINFIAKGPKQTLVTFEHRNIESLGKVVESMDQGWGLILDQYAEAAAIIINK